METSGDSLRGGGGEFCGNGQLTRDVQVGQVGRCAGKKGLKRQQVNPENCATIPEVFARSSRNSHGIMGCELGMSSSC